MIVKVYEFTDNLTNETFTGTIEEYAKKIGIHQQTIPKRVKAGRLTRKEVGSKDNGKLHNAYEFNDKALGRKFTGHYTEVCREWDLSYYQLKQRIKLGVIDVKKIKKSVKKVYYSDIESHKMTPLERKVSRQYWLERAQKLERES